MRTRWQVLGAALLVTATAVTSTLVAVRDADATDARLRAAALGRVRLSLVPPNDSAPPDPSSSGYAVTLHEDGSEGVVVRRAGWSGGVTDGLDTSLPAQADLSLVLPLPTRCPAHVVTRGFDSVDVVVEAAGGRRTFRLPVPDPQQPRAELNARCGLLTAAESLGSTGVGPVEVRPGHLVLDLSAAASGSRDTEVVAVRAAQGVQAQVVDRLPVTAYRVPSSGGLVFLRHLLTVQLTLRDCARVRAARGQVVDGIEVLPAEGAAAPTYFQVQLDVRHPGEPVEQLDVTFPQEAADAFVAPCHLPPLPRPGSGVGYSSTVTVGG